jgi:hypothetical protein
MATQSLPRHGAIDHEGLTVALRALGILDGASEPLATVACDARDEAEAVRVYIAHERPHLLSCYDMDTLVGMVSMVRSSNVEHPAALEPFLPA